MTKPREIDWIKTRKSSDYRSFLSAYLEENAWSLSDFARATGFGRGFPGDVISGRRRLTAKSYVAFESALKLPLSGRKLFRYLVAMEVPGIFPGLNPASIERSIEELRTKHWTRVRSHVAAKDQSDVRLLFSNPHVFAVYAAAGTAAKGATLATIIERTRLSDREVQDAIAGLQKARLMSCDGGVYRPEDTHLFLKAIGKSEAFIQLFQTVCQQAAARVPQALQSDTEMFFTSSFCVDEKRLPELKVALRKTVLQFVDDAIDSDGGRVTQLVAAMF